ncbi:Magnesium transporter, partial [Nymphaea thermarum]
FFLTDTAPPPLFHVQLFFCHGAILQIHDEIEQLMNDDGDMAEMYLTEKKEQNEAYFLNNHHFLSCAAGPGVFHSAPVSPISSPSGSPKLEKDSYSFASRSKHGSLRSSGTNNEHIQELEMLLEAYFVVIDNTLNKLSSLKEYIDDTEDFLNIKLDNVRNQLIQIELLVTAGTFVIAIFGVVTGIFGMNIPIDLFNYSSAFDWVLIISTVVGGLMFLSFLWYFKHKRLMFM